MKRYAERRRGAQPLGRIAAALLGLALAAAGATATPGAQTDDADPEAVLARFCAGERVTVAELHAAARADVAAVIAILADLELAGVVRFQAANLLGEVGGAAAEDALLAALDDGYFNVRRCAALALGKLGCERARARLAELAERDPFVHVDRETGEELRLVRTDALRALELLDEIAAQVEVFGAREAPPEHRAPARVAKLPWPLPGGFRAQHVYNGYQQPTDGYVHSALDLLQPAGTEVRAVAGGTVAFVTTNYPDWTTHHFFVVVPDGERAEGWCYTHVDPATYAFEVGERVEQGAVLGKIVAFSLGDRPGVDHLHLHYVRFEERADGRYDVESLFDPLLAFDYTDELAPTVHALWIVRRRTLSRVPVGADGVPIVTGDVDVLAAVSDAAHEGHVANWGVAWAELEIAPSPGAGDAQRAGDSDASAPPVERAAPWRKLVLDQRGRVGDTRAAATLWLKHAEREPFVEDLPRNPVVHVLRASASDGDGVLEATDARYAWRTATTDAEGRPLWPNGLWRVTVRVRDLAGHPAERALGVRVANE